MLVRCDYCDTPIRAVKKDDADVWAPHEGKKGACLGSGKSCKARMDKGDVLPERVRRFDYVEALAAPERLASGFLRLEGKIARTGVQVYQQMDGSIRRELRLPEEVDKSLKSFAMLPVTNQHPPRLLDARTATSYAVGAVGQEIRRDGDFVIAPFSLWDERAIKDAEAGRQQLSNGYTCELQESPGVYNGERYDAIQRNIDGNHLAMVDVARAGEDARMRLDHAKLDFADGWVVASKSLDSPVVPPPAPPKERKMQIRIDSLNLEVNDANAAAIQAAHDRAVIDAEKRGSSKTDVERARADSEKGLKEAAQAALKELQGKFDAVRAKLDAKKAKGEMVECDACDGEGEVDGEKCDACGGKGEVKAKADEDEDGDEVADKKKKDAFKKEKKDAFDRALAQRTRQRVALEVAARKILGDETKLDGLSSDEIKRQVIVKVDGDDAKVLEKESGVYLRSRFDGAVKHAERATGSGQGSSAADLARAAALGGAGQGNGAGAGQGRSDSAKSAQEKYNERQNNAWKRPEAK